MIEKVEIISQPVSGKYEERIYDLQSSWNSQDWTWIRFTNEDLSEWCGVFRGYPKSAYLSKKYNVLLVLTSDYLFLLDRDNVDVIDFEEHSPYLYLTLSPNEDFIVADNHNLTKIKNSLRDKSVINSPIKMDFIEFKIWNNQKLEFECDEFYSWDKHYLMEYDCLTDKIEIKKHLTEPIHNTQQPKG